MISVKKFNQLYDVCFDENDKIKVCGREACRDLLYFLKNKKYGDINSGKLNIPEVVALHKKLNKKD